MSMVPAHRTLGKQSVLLAVPQGTQADERGVLKGYVMQVLDALVAGVLNQHPESHQIRGVVDSGDTQHLGLLVIAPPHVPRPADIYWQDGDRRAKIGTLEPTKLRANHLGFVDVDPKYHTRLAVSDPVAEQGQANLCNKVAIGDSHGNRIEGQVSQVDITLKWSRLFGQFCSVSKVYRV